MHMRIFLIYSYVICALPRNMAHATNRDRKNLRNKKNVCFNWRCLPVAAAAGSMCTVVVVAAAHPARIVDIMLFA